VARQGVCDLPSSRLERWPDEEGSANGALDGDGGSFTAADAQRNCQAIIGNIFGIFSKCPLKLLNNQADFDSDIRRFDPAGPVRLFAELVSSIIRHWNNALLEKRCYSDVLTASSTECITT
jgi:hypothetical protein